MTVSIAMIALGANPQISGAEVLAELERQWPDMSTVELGSDEDQVFMLKVDPFLIAGAIMPAAIPWSELEGPCATSILWKDAANVLKEHKNHLVLSALGDGDPIERMRLLTRATAAVLATCVEAVGVYWGGATLVMPPGLFCEFSKEKPEWPLPLWIDVRTGQNEQGSTSGFTTGMESLGHMEIETQNASDSPSNLYQRMFALADYVLQSGRAINDGDTIGEDNNERIRVIYSKSAFGHDGRVMRLDYSAIERRVKPWWKVW